MKSNMCHSRESGNPESEIKKNGSPVKPGMTGGSGQALRQSFPRHGSGQALRQGSGQAIIEVMIAISALTIGFLGVVGLLSRSLALNRVVSDNYTATYLASEGVEVVKNILDANAILIASGRPIPWNAGFSDGDFEVDYKSLSLGSYQDRTLSFDSTAMQYSYAGSVPTTFKRRVHIALVSANEIRVNTFVNWVTRGGGSFEVNLEDHFFNWRF